MSDTPAIKTVNQLLRYLKEKCPGRLKCIDRDDPHYLFFAIQDISTAMIPVLEERFKQLERGDKVIFAERRWPSGIRSYVNVVDITFRVYCLNDISPVVKVAGYTRGEGKVLRDRFELDSFTSPVGV